MKTWLYAAVAAVALAGAAPAQAATFNTPNPGPGGAITYAFGDNQVDEVGAFSRTFTFNPGPAGLFSISFLETAPANPVNNLEFTSAAFNGATVTIAFLDGGEPDVGFLNNVSVAAGVLSTLVINGVSGGNGVFTGTAAFTPSAVPLPGAVFLMGSVLLGGAGFARFRKRQQASALQAA